MIIHRITKIVLNKLKLDRKLKTNFRKKIKLLNFLKKIFFICPPNWNFSKFGPINACALPSHHIVLIHPKLDKFSFVSSFQAPKHSTFSIQPVFDIYRHLKKAIKIKVWVYTFLKLNGKKRMRK